MRRNLNKQRDLVLGYFLFAALFFFCHIRCSFFRFILQTTINPCVVVVICCYRGRRINRKEKHFFCDLDSFHHMPSYRLVSSEDSI